MTEGQINEIFTYHQPTGTQQARYVAIRDAARQFALFLNANCPESREKSIAFTDLQRCVQMANASIAIGETGVSAADMPLLAPFESFAKDPRLGEANGEKP